MKNQLLNRYRLFRVPRGTAYKGPSVPDRNIGNLYSGTEGTGAPFGFERCKCELHFLDTKKQNLKACGENLKPNLY